MVRKQIPCRSVGNTSCAKSSGVPDEFSISFLRNLANFPANSHRVGQAVPLLAPIIVNYCQFVSAAKL
jgi:hypothetical protein